MAKKNSVVKPKALVVKPKKPRSTPEVYRPSVYIDSNQNRTIKKLKLGQRVVLTGTVTSRTDNQRKGKKPSVDINIEIKKLKAGKRGRM